MVAGESHRNSQQRIRILRFLNCKAKLFGNMSSSSSTAETRIATSSNPPQRSENHGEDGALGSQQRSDADHVSSAASARQNHLQTLCTSFPLVPVAILGQVLQNSNNNATVATAWLLDHDWRRERQLRHEELESENSLDAGDGSFVNEPTEENEEDEESIQRLSRQERALEFGNFLFFQPRKRSRITIEPTPERENKEKFTFWVSLDGKLMEKTHLELLNVNLRHSAHSSISLLNIKSNFINEKEAKERLSFTRRPQVRKGYWAHVFDIDDIDEVWRAMCSDHVVGRKAFGDRFEISSCFSSGKQDEFDMMSSRSRLRKSGTVALLVPCDCNEPTMKEIAAAISRALNLRDPIYYRFLESEERKEDFFKVLSKDEHILASQYKFEGEPQGKSPSISSSPSMTHRQNFGSSVRFRPPQFQHRDGKEVLYKLQGVKWCKVDL